MNDRHRRVAKLKKQENQLMKNMLQKTEFSFFGELDKYK